MSHCIQWFCVSVAYSIKSNRQLHFYVAQVFAIRVKDLKGSVFLAFSLGSLLWTFDDKKWAKCLNSVIKITKDFNTTLDEPIDFWQCQSENSNSMNSLTFIVSIRSCWYLSHWAIHISWNILVVYWFDHIFYF